MTSHAWTFSQVAPMLALVTALGFLGACGDDDGTGPPPPPPTGSVEVTTATAGESIDADGYMVAVAGGTAQPIGTDAALTVDDIEAGATSVELTGVAPNCTVAGDNPRDVTVPDGGTVTTTFEVNCAAAGALVITAATTGEQLDADGYMVAVGGGPAQAIDLNETLIVEPLAAGSRAVELIGVAGNCIVAGDNPRDVTVIADGTVSTQFDVTCVVPISGQIVFLTDRDGDAEVYVMNEDGTSPVNLSNSPGIDTTPTISPDGTRLAFTSMRDGNFEIYVMNADGSGQQRLTNSAGNDIYPAWSPDGTQILFASARSGDMQIWVMNADGSAVTNLSATPGAGHAFADWSPDGTQILFTTDRDGNGEVYVMNADGSGQTNLTNHPSFDGSPAWSPDGSRILFDSGRDGNPDVYVMNADGSGPTNLTNHSSYDASGVWSPDGTRVLFYTERAGDPEIYVMNADGSGVTNLTNSAMSHEAPGYPNAWR